MVIADCESELFRDCSRGLEGGAFFLATILNRKEAKLKKGKDAIDSLKDFIMLKADARFCQYYIKKFNLNTDFDNTPVLLKSASPERKEKFLHDKVEEALRDLIPYFRNCSSSDPHLQDHPLQEGRRDRCSSSRDAPRKETSLDPPLLIDGDVVERTVQQLQQVEAPDAIEANMEEVSVNLSATRSSRVYRCMLCDFRCRFRTVCLSHVEGCLLAQQKSYESPEDNHDESIGQGLSSSSSETLSKDPENVVDAIDDDMFWNYKSCEFLIDSIFCVTSNFEKFGDGLGCYIINKIMLPVIHGLKHSNYSTSIHRFITRVLCEATPKEGLKLIHEKFSNRVGKPGQNIHRDRRMEFRIGTAKKLIGNLGPNFSKESVQQVKCTLDIKEELFKVTREMHGVDIRGGRHSARSDMKDYELLFSKLTETRAHQKIRGRTFGNLVFKEDLLEDDERFSKVKFYRWIVEKNKEAVSVHNAKRK